MNLHISVFGAAWALLVAAWAKSPPYRQDGLCQPLVEPRLNKCMFLPASELTPEWEDFSSKQQRSCEVRSKMHGIGTDTQHDEHSPTVWARGAPSIDSEQGCIEPKEFQPRDITDYTNLTFNEKLQQMDEARGEALPPDHAQDVPARREHKPRDLIGYQAPNYVKETCPRTEEQADVIHLMQQGSTKAGWFEQARKGLSVLLARGTGRQAALQLRDQLRAYSSPDLHRAVMAHLPPILDAEARDDAEVCITEEGWVRHVLNNLARVAGLDDEAKATLLGQYAEDALETELKPTPHLPQNRTAILGENTWAPAGPGRIAPAGEPAQDSPVQGSNISDPEDLEASSLFQTQQEADLWDSLMEQFWEWFAEGRAVDMAVAMLRQRARDRRDMHYQQWVLRPISNLGAGIEVNEQGTAETTPRDFYRWARRVESLLHTTYLREGVPASGDESSLMDRYRNGRRRIRDSRTPRREARRPVCVTTETRRLEGRRPASSSSNAGQRGEADRAERPRHGDVLPAHRGGEERASGSTDRPRRESVATGPVDPDLPDPQQPFTMEQSLQMWKYLLFDRWIFSIPREGGRIPTSWLPRDTLNDINVHLAGMSNHNLLMMTTGLVTMVRYLMAELSQSLDMAQVVLNTRNGEPALDLDEEAEEEVDEAGLMQGFFASGGVDTADRRWSRAMMRLHKELEGQPKPTRVQSLVRLRSALPPLQQSGPQTSWQEQLVALLTAVSIDCADVQGHAQAPQGWLEGWIGELGCFIPGLQLRPDPQVIDTQLNATVEELLQDEEEERARKAGLAAQQADEEAYREAREALEEQELRHLAEEAEQYREWEQAQTADALRRTAVGVAPSKRRCVLTMEVASGSGDHPRRVQTLGYDLPADGSPLIFTIRAQMEETPSEVPTQMVPERPAASNNDGGEAPEPQETHHEAPPEVSLQAQRPTQADLLGLLDFSEYEAIYDKWRQGELTQGDIIEQFGADVAEMVLAQEAVRDVIDGENSEVERTESKTSLVTPATQTGGHDEAQARVPYGTFEMVYRKWKDGHLQDGEVLDTHGPLWLSLFQQWRTWGLEAIWDLLENVLEVQPVPEPGTKAATEAQPAVPLSLPLRVPLFAVRALLDRWTNGDISSEEVQRNYGHIWLRLLHKMKEVPYAKLRLGWSSLVDWDKEHAEDASMQSVPVPADGVHDPVDRRGMVKGADGVWRRHTLEEFEGLFERWHAGQLPTEEVHKIYGVDWLALFIQRREWGLEGVRDHLDKVLDTVPESGAAIRPVGTHLRPPAELSLPLRVPWSTVKEEIRRWMIGLVSDEWVAGKHGVRWLELFQLVKNHGVTKAWSRLDLVVDWDVPAQPEGWLRQLDKGEK